MDDNIITESWTNDGNPFLWVRPLNKITAQIYKTHGYTCCYMVMNERVFNAMVYVSEYYDIDKGKFGAYLIGIDNAMGDNEINIFYLTTLVGKMNIQYNLKPYWKL